MYLCVLSLFLVLTVAECKDCSVETETVSGWAEGNVFLPCLHLKPEELDSNYRVKWTKHVAGGGEAKVIFSKPAPTQLPVSERVKLEADGRGQLSLLLTNLQTSDVGLYTCEIWKAWDCIVQKNISLRVKDCKNHLERVALGKAVNLSCPMDAQLGQETPQNVSWSLLKGGNPVFFSSDTLFYIPSVGMEVLGWYRCKYTMGETQRCIDINLVQATMLPAPSTSTEEVSTTRTTVLETRSTEEKQEKMKREEIAACVVSVIIGLIFIAAVIGLCIYYKSMTPTQQRGAGIQSTDEWHSYEMVETGPSDATIKQRVCSLYEACQEESMQTFTY